MRTPCAFLSAAPGRCLLLLLLRLLWLWRHVVRQVVSRGQDHGRVTPA